MVTEMRSESLKEARTDLAAQWNSADPKTPDQVLRFYRGANMADDLNSWHETMERQAWTSMLLHVARERHAERVVDIGCGAGHDLRALRASGVPNVSGVEPNLNFQRYLRAEGISVHASVDQAPIHEADLIICVDVLEHIPEPESFLADALQYAKIGTILFEATATHGNGNPLHLKSNRGWQPGRWLEQHGWWLVDQTNRVHVWEKQLPEGRQTSSLLMAASRLPGALFPSIKLTGSGNPLWRMHANVGDALIGRSRSILVHNWYYSTGDDTFLMVDDDIQFSSQDADRAVEYCRAGFDILCGGYVVRDGTHLAARTFPGMTSIDFGPPHTDERGVFQQQLPIEIQWAATGFMAVHRRVIDAMVERLPLVNSGYPWYKPFFHETWQYDEAVDGELFLSEDWAFCELARQLGFKVWLDPQTRLVHEGRTVPLTVGNMREVQDAIAKA